MELVHPGGVTGPLASVRILDAMSGFAPADSPRAESPRARLLRGTLEVAVVDAAVIAVCAGLAALLGEFQRSAIGVLVLWAGGLALLLGAVSAGAFQLFNSANAAALSPMNYANTMHAEMLLREEMRSPAVAADARRRRRFGLRVVLIGLSLVVLAIVIGG